MTALNFSVFLDKVERREKCQTIRKGCHNHKVGRHIQLYSGLRTSAARKLVNEDPICKSIDPIVIGRYWVKIHGRLISSQTTQEIARDDGFESLTEFFDYFCTERPVFVGYLIKWDWPDAG